MPTLTAGPTSTAVISIPGRTRNSGALDPHGRKGVDGSLRIGGRRAGLYASAVTAGRPAAPLLKSAAMKVCLRGFLYRRAVATISAEENCASRQPRGSMRPVRTSAGFACRLSWNDFRPTADLP
jgi:hypothetical protein